MKSQKWQLRDSDYWFIFISFKIARWRVMELEVKKIKLKVVTCLSTARWLKKKQKRLSRQCETNSYSNFWFDGGHLST